MNTQQKPDYGLGIRAMFISTASEKKLEAAEKSIVIEEID